MALYINGNEEDNTITRTVSRVNGSPSFSERPLFKYMLKSPRIIRIRRSINRGIHGYTLNFRSTMNMCSFTERDHLALPPLLPLFRSAADSPFNDSLIASTSKIAPPSPPRDSFLVIYDRRVKTDESGVRRSRGLLRRES